LASTICQPTNNLWMGDAKPTKFTAQVPNIWFFSRKNANPIPLIHFWHCISQRVRKNTRVSKKKIRKK
jgi:hypothetical protein